MQAAWELQDGNSSFFNDTKLPSQTHSGITEAWKQSLRARDRRSSTPPFATDPSSPEAAHRRSSVHSAAAVRSLLSAGLLQLLLLRPANEREYSRP